MIRKTQDGATSRVAQAPKKGVQRKEYFKGNFARYPSLFQRCHFSVFKRISIFLQNQKIMFFF